MFDLQGWADTSYTVAECRAGEKFCIEFLTGEEKETLRDCWDPAYYDKYDYVGCQVTQSCFRGACYNTTVCICEVDMTYTTGATVARWLNYRLINSSHLFIRIDLS